MITQPALQLPEATLSQNVTHQHGLFVVEILYWQDTRQTVKKKESTALFFISIQNCGTITWDTAHADFIAQFTELFIQSL